MRENEFKGGPHYSVASDERVRIARKEGIPQMIFERITAWMLVAIYYTVFMGVLLFGLRGAL